MITGEILTSILNITNCETEEIYCVKYFLSLAVYVPKFHVEIIWPLLMEGD